MSVCLSVTCQYSVKTAIHILTHTFSLSGSQTRLVFSVPNGVTVFRWQAHNEAIECRGYEKNRDFRPVSRFVSEMIQDRVLAAIEGERENSFE